MFNNDYLGRIKEKEEPESEFSKPVLVLSAEVRYWSVTCETKIMSLLQGSISLKFQKDIQVEMIIVRKKSETWMKKRARDLGQSGGRAQRVYPSLEC